MVCVCGLFKYLQNKCLQFFLRSWDVLADWVEFGRLFHQNGKERVKVLETNFVAHSGVSQSAVKGGQGAYGPEAAGAHDDVLWGA